MRIYDDEAAAPLEHETKDQIEHGVGSFQAAIR